MSREKIINWLLFIVLSLVWGSSFILMKASKEHLNGYQIGAIRIFSAGIIFLPFALVHITKIPRNKLGLVALSGLLGNFLPAFLFAIAIENRIDSSLAGILNSLTPLFVIIISVAVYKSPIAAKKTAGVIIGFIGLIILSLSKGGISFNNMGYASLILLATICYGLNVNLVSRYLKGVSPLHMATVSLAIMSFGALGVAFAEEVPAIIKYDEGARLSIIYAALLGVVGSAFATVLFYILIKRAGALFAALVTYGIPVVAITWGIIANEDVTGLQITCLGIILSGVFLANKA